MRDRVRDVCWAPRGSSNFWAQCGWNGGRKGWTLLPLPSQLVLGEGPHRAGCEISHGVGGTYVGGGQWTKGHHQLRSDFGLHPSLAL